MGSRQQAIDAMTRRGYVIVPALWDAAECERMRRALHELWQTMGAGDTGGEFGFIFHPVLPRLPILAELYARSEIQDLVGAILQDEPRLAHNGALLSDRRRRFTSWHYHRPDSTEPCVWDLARAQRPRRIERVLAQVYVDGSNAETGELLLLARAVDDPLAPPRRDAGVEWPEQTVITCPPGSLVIFDQSVFHAARGSQSDRPRHLIGGHYQGWSNPTPHREDNVALTRGLTGTLIDHPGLVPLVLPPDPG